MNSEAQIVLEEDVLDELELEIDDDDIIYQINSFGVDFLVDGLVSRMEKGDIYVPEFQRNFVWTHPQASRFIESILLGLPIPGIFLYREEATQKHLIIDGLQRLTTLRAYHVGRLPGNEKPFRLVGVQNRFEGRSILELDPSDQRRFQDTAIHATIIQQSNPKDDHSSIYHIFERLNSGGTPLQPQEMRAAIYHGPFQTLLAELNENEAWRQVFGQKNKRAKDQELILRFLAFRFASDEYQAPIKSFLNNFMGRNQNISGSAVTEFSVAFCSAIERAFDALGNKAFRPAKVLNAAVFDSILVAISRYEYLKSEQIFQAYERTVSNAEYLEAVSRSTSDETNVVRRFAIADQYFKNASGN
ncbi:MAG: DUF262 domain-containing protein [Rhizobium sp.]|nr:DUF262 domain-containing protein [Rhizobium sp.]